MQVSDTFKRKQWGPGISAVVVLEWILVLLWPLDSAHLASARLSARFTVSGSQHGAGGTTRTPLPPRVARFASEWAARQLGALPSLLAVAAAEAASSCPGPATHIASR